MGVPLLSNPSLHPPSASGIGVGIRLSSFYEKPTGMKVRTASGRGRENGNPDSGHTTQRHVSRRRAVLCEPRQRLLEAGGRSIEPESGGFAIPRQNPMLDGESHRALGRISNLRSPRQHGWQHYRATAKRLQHPGMPSPEHQVGLLQW